MLCLDENLNKGNTLEYVDFVFRCLGFGVAGLYFPWNVRRADLDAIWKCLYVIFSQYVKCLIHAF